LKPPAIILHGPTSAGKSSLAKALQDTAAVPAFHVSLDAFVTMSRRRDMRSPDEVRSAYQLHCENLRSVLGRLVDTDFEIIVDFVLRDEAELQDTFRVLSGRPMYLVGVQAPLEVLEERERRREDRGVGMAREHMANPAFNRAYDLVIDTSRHSPEEGAVAIRNFVRDHPA
jgi:chloramphenicol 3-O phosphotransferase